MAHPVIKKLEFFGPLPDEDKALVKTAIGLEEDVPAGIDLIREGDDPSVVFLVTSGFACRYKLLAHGKRQIVAFLVPGDFGDIYAFVLKTMDHSISTMAPSKVVRLSRDAFLRMLDRPALARALFMATLSDLAILREWITTIGQRNAELRIAHLFCEVTARLRAVGMISDKGVISLPLTQNDLSDAVGLSNVHTNRSLQALREKGLIRFASGNLELLDAERLEKLCDFKSNYLHLSS